MTYQILVILKLVIEIIYIWHFQSTFINRMRPSWYLGISLQLCLLHNSIYIWINVLCFDWRHFLCITKISSLLLRHMLVIRSVFLTLCKCVHFIFFFVMNLPIFFEKNLIFFQFYFWTFQTFLFHLLLIHSIYYENFDHFVLVNFPNKKCW